MKKIYKLTPTLHDNIWGGNKLREYGKVSDKDRIAESWELSFVKGNEAGVEGGALVSETFSRDAWGTNTDKFEFFPTLTKFIDAREKLSVQVHPDDEYALRYEGQYGKSEMWYVVDAEPGAGIYMGLSRRCDADEFRSRVADGTVEEVLSFVEVKPRDVYYIPAGTVHAIGAGVLIFEIQQNSTLTYRLYDYMRKDKDGNQRPLHIDAAMKVSKLEEYKSIDKSPDSEVIGRCKYFETSECVIDGNREFSVGSESFLCFTCVSGKGMLEGEPIRIGDTFFAPARAGKITASGKMTLITVSIP